jgi:hypothetical protein
MTYIYDPFPSKKAHRDKLLKKKAVHPSKCPTTGAQWDSTHAGTFHFINHIIRLMKYKI